MDYLEEEARPRFLFQSRPNATSSSPENPPETLIKVGKLHAAASFAAAIAVLLAAVSLSHHETLAFLLAWISLSLLAAPFAPPSLTGGDPRVGLGELLPPPPLPDLAPSDAPADRRRPRSRAADPSPPPPTIPAATKSPPPIPAAIANGDDHHPQEEEEEWRDEDFDILKKQISKHPAGEPRRWERISEAFGGRHGVESVIKAAKSMSEKRPGSGDSFVQFLKHRKPLDKRAEVVGDDGGGVEGGGCWSSGEDIALLNALKAFPKDVSMRWEKITAAVPGRSKASCMKRVGELKRDFRSSKASQD